MSSSPLVPRPSPARAAPPTRSARRRQRSEVRRRLDLWRHLGLRDLDAEVDHELEASSSGKVPRLPHGLAGRAHRDDEGGPRRHRQGRRGERHLLRPDAVDHRAIRRSAGISVERAADAHRRWRQVQRVPTVELRSLGDLQRAGRERQVPRQAPCAVADFLRAELHAFDYCAFARRTRASSYEAIERQAADGGYVSRPPMRSRNGNSRSGS